MFLLDIVPYSDVAVQVVRLAVGVGVAEHEVGGCVFCRRMTNVTPFLDRHHVTINN